MLITTKRLSAGWLPQAEYYNCTHWAWTPILKSYFTNNKIQAKKALVETLDNLADHRYKDIINSILKTTNYLYVYEWYSVLEAKL